LLVSLCVVVLSVVSWVVIYGLFVILWICVVFLVSVVGLWGFLVFICSVIFGGL